MSQVSPSRIAERLLLGAFPLLTLDTPDTFINLVEYFESGRRRSSGSAPMLGQRPVISRNPLKLADHYVWWSWDQVDVRRRHLGSALYRLFADGVVSSPLKGVGIYSANCPGMSRVLNLVRVPLIDGALSVAARRAILQRI